MAAEYAETYGERDAIHDHGRHRCATIGRVAIGRVTIHHAGGGFGMRGSRDGGGCEAREPLEHSNVRHAVREGAPSDPDSL